MFASSKEQYPGGYKNRDRWGYNVIAGMMRRVDRLAWELVRGRAKGCESCHTSLYACGPDFELDVRSGDRHMCEKKGGGKAQRPFPKPWLTLDVYRFFLNSQDTNRRRRMVVLMLMLAMVILAYNGGICTVHCKQYS